MPVPAVFDRPRRALTLSLPGHRWAYVMLDLKRRRPYVRVLCPGLDHVLRAAVGPFNVRRARREDASASGWRADKGWTMRTRSPPSRAVLRLGCRHGISITVAA